MQTVTDRMTLASSCSSPLDPFGIIIGVCGLLICLTFPFHKSLSKASHLCKPPLAQSAASCSAYIHLDLPLALLPSHSTSILCSLIYFYNLILLYHLIRY